jgi:predicted DCC family thiol-disulfide oxidoreductase YuxK
MSGPALTVWYDAACPLCAREIALMRRLVPEGQVAFVDVSAPGAACPIDRAALLARFHAQEAGGPLLSGAAAFAAMWRQTRLLRPLGVVARSPAALALLERLYRAFLRVRPRVQRLAGAGGPASPPHGGVAPTPARPGRAG